MTRIELLLKDFGWTPSCGHVMPNRCASCVAKILPVLLTVAVGISTLVIFGIILST